MNPLLHTLSSSSSLSGNMYASCRNWWQNLSQQEAWRWRPFIIRIFTGGTYSWSWYGASPHMLPIWTVCTRECILWKRLVQLKLPHVSLYAVRPKSAGPRGVCTHFCAWIRIITRTPMCGSPYYSAFSNLPGLMERQDRLYTCGSFIHLEEPNLEHCVRIKEQNECIRFQYAFNKESDIQSATAAHRYPRISSYKYALENYTSSLSHRENPVTQRRIMHFALVTMPLQELSVSAPKHAVYRGL